MRAAVTVRKVVPALCALLFIAFSALRSVEPGPKVTYKFIIGKSIVQAKNYYLLTLLANIPEARNLLVKDAVFRQLTQQRFDTLAAALQHCGRDGTCYVQRMKFDSSAIKLVSDRIRALYAPGNALDKLVKEHLLPSGTYIRFSQDAPVEMLVKAWEQDAYGVNWSIGVYAGGDKPNYPLIDSIAFNTWDKKTGARYNAGYTSLLYNTVSLVVAQRDELDLFFEAPLAFSLRFIEMNEREQAADFEPMEKGENAAAVKKVTTVRWEQYNYSVILVPGAGPDDPAVPLSAEGMLRCRLAARLYAKGYAPFIMPSGGRVHPYKTKYCEATEMKKYLVEKLGVPSDAVIIEPHARHTTTNMRNAARLMYRYGFPFDKVALTCTTRGQSSMIERTLPKRCMRELKAVPYKTGKRLSETELEFYPLMAALHINPSEPMDP